MDEINVLYLSYDGMTDPLGQSQVLPYLRGLSKLGYTIHLISFEKSERFAEYEKDINRICVDAEITWYPQNYTKKPPLISTMKDIRQMRSLSHQLVKKENIKIVHCRSYIPALIGLGLKRKFRTKFLFDMRGFWADERVDGKLWSIKNPIFRGVYRYFKKKEIQFFKHADHIVSLTENGKNEIISWKEFEEKKLPISVIPCCVDLELFNPDKIKTEAKTELIDALNLSETPILGYVGSIGTWYMLPEMLDFFKVWKEKNKNGKFLFVTGEQPASIVSLAKEKSITAEDIIIRSCSHREVPLYIAIMDLSVFFIRPTYSKKASSPTKQGEIMAMGVPLVCNAGVGDTESIVKKYQAGIVLQECTIDKYKQINLSTIASSEMIREGALETFSLEMGVKEYSDIYERLWKK